MLSFLGCLACRAVHFYPPKDLVLYDFATPGLLFSSHSQCSLKSVSLFSTFQSSLHIPSPFHQGSRCRTCSHSTTTWRRRSLWVAGPTRQDPWRRSLSMSSGKTLSWAPSSHHGSWSPQRWPTACPQTSTCSATTSPPWVFWVRLATFLYLLFKGNIVLTCAFSLIIWLPLHALYIINYLLYFTIYFPVLLEDT